MATYKISYLLNNSYNNRDEHYVDNATDEYDAVEIMVDKYKLPQDVVILSVDLVCE